MSDDKVQKTGTAAMDRPSFIPTTQAGTEHITRDDLRLPRLAIAQGLSPQINDPNSPKYIKELRLGEMFNDFTSEILGKGPLRFMIVRADPPRFIEFYPRENGGGVKDMNVPPNDPRTRFAIDPTSGKSIKPAATKFYDYVLLLLPLKSNNPMDSMIALSLKNSELKVARDLNTLIKYRNAPLYAGVYEMTAVSETNSKGTYGVRRIANAGWPETEELMNFAKNCYDAIKDKKLAIDREPGEDDGDFPGAGTDAHQM